MRSRSVLRAGTAVEGPARAARSRGTIGPPTVHPRRTPLRGPDPMRVPSTRRHARIARKLSWLVVAGLVATAILILATAPVVTGHQDHPGSTPTWPATDEPTGTPTDEPTGTPTDEATGTPTDRPSWTPSDEPSGPPTPTPSGTPTPTPSGTPTPTPTGTPTPTPSGPPSGSPSSPPSGSPSGPPTSTPSSPTFSPTSTIETETGTPGHPLPPTDGFSETGGMVRSGVSMALLALAALLTAALFITPSWAKKPTRPRDRR
jgi:hypothetical protein